ncbi:hypothetical protein AVEN_18492-1 [Araneus ventricosus]|uniref:Uncharacterized protein n=1 Tax=Araneus ventricosus TaxID=182803 RepID=A0A4Y2UCG3_ARAVE|nr:hypothetical protein AVEN_260967-1 [Araneus ventricosus]GBO09260.1 hypothetical protein AVEN_18492-1 [Araneus ventricosus]
MRRPGRPSISEEEVMLLPRYWTVIDAIRFVSWPEMHTTVLHILKECLGMRKIASRWVPHDLTEMQKWLRYKAARSNFQCYEREGKAFLRRTITLDDT